MYELIALPVAIVVLLISQLLCKRSGTPSLGVSSLGAILSVPACIAVVRILPYPDASRTDHTSLAICVNLLLLLIQFSSGVAAGIIATGLGILVVKKKRPSSLDRVDIQVPWDSLGWVSFIIECMTLASALAILFLGYGSLRRNSTGTVASSTDIYDDIAYFVIVVVFFQFIPLVLIARLFAYSAAWSFFNHRRKEKAQEGVPLTSGETVVFLRSFQTAKTRRKTVMGYNPFVSLFIPWSHSYFQRWIGETCDEVLRPAVEDRIGRFVGISDPSGHLPNLGAEVTYASDTDWKDIAIQLISSSRAILLLEGTTEGLTWELSHLKRHENAGKIILLTLPHRFHRPKTMWKDFQKILLQSGFPRIDDPGPGAAVAFTDLWEPVILARSTADADAMIQSVADWVTRLRHSQTGTTGRHSF